jgi:hypothetical protein
MSTATVSLPSYIELSSACLISATDSWHDNTTVCCKSWVFECWKGREWAEFPVPCFLVCFFRVVNHNYPASHLPDRVPTALPSPFPSRRNSKYTTRTAPRCVVRFPPVSLTFIFRNSPNSSSSLMVPGVRPVRRLNFSIPRAHIIQGTEIARRPGYCSHRDTSGASWRKSSMLSSRASKVRLGSAVHSNLSPAQMLTLWPRASSRRAATSWDGSYPFGSATRPQG